MSFLYDSIQPWVREKAIFKLENGTGKCNGVYCVCLAITNF